MTVGHRGQHLQELETQVNDWFDGSRVVVRTRPTLVESRLLVTEPELSSAWCLVKAELGHNVSRIRTQQRKWGRDWLTDWQTDWLGANTSEMKTVNHVDMNLILHTLPLLLWIIETRATATYLQTIKKIKNVNIFEWNYMKILTWVWVKVTDCPWCVLTI